MSSKTKPIKILFLIDQLCKGGTENQLIWLVENLPIERFSVFLGVLRHNSYSKSLELRTPIINFDCLNIPVYRNLKRIRTLQKFISEKKIDIVQTQFQNSELYGVIASKISRQKAITISTRRNLYHWVNGFEGNLLFFLTKFVVRYVDFVLTNSCKVGHLCQTLEKVKSSKVKVIQNAIPLEKFENVDSVITRLQFNLSEKDIVIGVVGNWRPVKGLKVFIDAAAVVNNNIDNTFFILVGNGSQEHELREQCSILGIKDKVAFLDNNTHIPSILTIFDIAVQPSFSESFSNVLLEYMASSKPIVATCVGDAEQVIENEKEGILISSGDAQSMADAIIRLVNSSEERLKLGQNALKKVKKNWKDEIILKQYVNFYLDIVS